MKCLAIDFTDVLGLSLTPHSLTILRQDHFVRSGMNQKKPPITNRGQGRVQDQLNTEP